METTNEHPSEPTPTEAVCTAAEPAGNTKQMEELISESEYKTATEFIPEFQSDHEPPEDKIAEPRMIFKSQKLRVYKKILQVGRGNYMPAKYDRVTFKHVETEIESLNIRELEEVIPNVGQLGIDITDEELVCCLSNMKELEVSTFTIERVTYTEKRKRILESTRHLLAQMQTWETIIDMHGDMLCMKNISVRGVGQRRVNMQDEITFKARVYQDETNCLVDLNHERVLLNNIASELPTILVEVLLSAKAKEKSKTVVAWEWIFLSEKNEDFKNKLNANTPIVVELEVEKIVEIMDLFANGCVWKKVTKFSYSTAAPDENSCVFFDYIAFDSSNNQITATCKSFLQLLPTQDDIPSMKERGTPFCFLDEFEYSSALRKALSVGKKLEEFDLVINDGSKFRYGADFLKVRKILGEGKDFVFPITLKVKVYFFSNGENCYSMRLAQKQHYCESKKPKIAHMLKLGEYKKAAKMLNSVMEMVERRDQKSMTPEEQAEEIEGLKNQRRAAMMNLTLCQWRLSQWKDLIKTCQTILDQIEPQSGKILYRQCCAFMANKDYHLVTEKYSTFCKSFPDAVAEYPELAALAKEAAQKETLVKQKEKAMYAKMAGALGRDE